MISRDIYQRKNLAEDSKYEMTEKRKHKTTSLIHRKVWHKKFSEYLMLFRDGIQYVQKTKEIFSSIPRKVWYLLRFH